MKQEPGSNGPNPLPASVASNTTPTVSTRFQLTVRTLRHENSSAPPRSSSPAFALPCSPTVVPIARGAQPAETPVPSSAPSLHSPSHSNFLTAALRSSGSSSTLFAAPGVEERPAHPSLQTPPTKWEGEAHSVVPSSHPLPSSSPAPRYGGAIVRLSELRLLQQATISTVRPQAPPPLLERPPVTAVEGVETLPSHSPAAVGNDPLLAVARGAPRAAARRGTRRQRASDPPAFGTNGQRDRRGRRGRARGSRSTVELDGNGQPYPHRWFTERGRRCLVYNGRTYKGSTAHKMWAQLKRVGQSFATAALNGVATSAASVLLPTTPYRPTRRTRIAAATQRRRGGEGLGQTESSSARTHRVQGNAAVTTLPVTEDWAHLMDDLGLPDRDHTAPNGAPPSPVASPQAPLRRLPTKVPVPPRAHALTWLAPAPAATTKTSGGTPDVIEITDSDEEERVEEEKPTACVSRSAVEGLAGLRALPQWPVSYFDDDDDDGDRGGGSDHLGERRSTSSSGTSGRSDYTVGQACEADQRDKEEDGDSRGMTDASASGTGWAASVSAPLPDDVVVIDGWVYPAGLVSTTATTRSCECPPHRKRVKMETATGVPTMGSVPAPLPPSCGNVVWGDVDDDTPLVEVFAGDVKQLPRYSASPHYATSTIGVQLITGSGPKPLAETRGSECGLTPAWRAADLAARTTVGGTPSLVLDRYADTTDGALSAFSREALEGLLDTEEELGGFRCA